MIRSSDNDWWTNYKKEKKYFTRSLQINERKKMIKFQVHNELKNMTSFLNT